MELRLITAAALLFVRVMAIGQRPNCDHLRDTGCDPGDFRKCCGPTNGPFYVWCGWDFDDYGNEVYAWKGPILCPLGYYCKAKMTGNVKV